MSDIHDPNCLGHSECECSLARLKARIVKVLTAITNYDDYCYVCQFIGRERHRADCEVLALLKDCEA